MNFTLSTEIQGLTCQGEPAYTTHKPLLAIPAEEPMSFINRGCSHTLDCVAVDLVAEAVIARTLDGLIVSWNPAAEKIYGYPAREAIGRCVSMLYPPDRTDELSRILESVKQGEGVVDLETIQVRRDGAQIEVLLNICPIRDTSGKPTGAIAITRDLTASKQLEKALHRCDRLASLGRQVPMFAHEINNPLDSVGLLLYLIRHCRGLDPVAYEYAARAEQELERIAQLSRRVLDFCRDSGHTVPANIPEILDSVLELYAHKLKDRWHVHKRYEPVPMINCFPSEIRQVFSNLLVNAAEALCEGGSILLHVTHSRDWHDPAKRGVRVMIADNGTGICPEQRKHIFQPFFSTKGEKGNGLGLWISDGIVRKHGGSIRVCSSTRQGRTGTCFSVFLPVEGPLKCAATAA